MSQENTPAVLKYVMQGIRTPPKATSTGIDSDFSATEQARLPRDQQALISNSLFYTDYKKHDWLGYGRHAHDTHQPQDGNKVRHGARSLLLGPSSEPSCNMPRYHPNSTGAAPWDEREHQPQAASNSSAYDRSHLLAHDPPFQRLNSQASLSLEESRMSSFIPPYADEMYPRQSNLHQYSHFAQFPISSTIRGQDPRIEARVLSGAHNHLDPDIHLRSPVPSTLPSFSLAASNNYATPTRYLKVSNIPRNISMRDARDAFKSFGDLRGAFSASFESDGKMFLEFFDIRHAMSASANPRSHPLFSSSSIKVEYCSMATMSKVSSNILDNDNEGSLSVTITRPQLTTNEIVMFLTAQGDVWSFETNTRSCPPAVIVNYFDTRHAESAVVLLREMHVNQQISCRVLYHHKDPDSSPGMDSWPLLEAHESLLYQRVSALVDSPVSGSSETPSPEVSLNPKSTSSLSDTFASMTLGMANPALSKTFLGTQEVKNSKDHHQNDAHATTGQESKMVPSGNKQIASTDSTAATTLTDAMNKITLTEGAKSHCPTAPIQAPPRSGN
ncbi:hypothetical protein MVEG_01963 [Podila verticillata NRRL 6337]|nr:hypothetical protein MVEG_01963 [Podila verticillata NRRL 6337]